MKNGSLTPENAESLGGLIFLRQIEIFVLRTSVLYGIMVLANPLYAGGTAVCGLNTTRQPEENAIT